MAVWNNISINTLGPHFRLDAEYYRPDLISIGKRLDTLERGSKKLGEISNITNGHTPRLHDLSIGDIPFLTAEHINDYLIDFSGTDKRVRIDHHQGELKSTRLQKDDLLITIKGKIGNAAVVTSLPFECNINQDVALIRLLHPFDPYFILGYLNSAYGKAFMKRISTGQINPFLSVANLREVPIPLFINGRQNLIASFIKNTLNQVDKLHQQAKSSYSQAEVLLMEGINLRKPPNKHGFIGKYSDLENARRMDAEYFHPKYQWAMKVIMKSGKRIKDVAALVKRPFKPEDGKNFEYIEIGDLNGTGVAQSRSILGEDAPSRAKWKVSKGNIITSTVRPIRRLSAMIEPEQEGFVCSSGFVVLQPLDVAPEILLAYLRLPIVCEILDLFATASMYPAISTIDLMNIPLSIPSDKKIQKLIEEKISKSRKANREAYRLLNSIEKRVNELIEK